MIFRAVVFDLDGTLVDSLEDLAGSMNQVLRNRGFAEHSLETYKYFIGDGMAHLVSRALPAHIQDEATVKGCILEMQAEYGRRWQDATRLYPGVHELLQGLESRGMALALLSNKPHEFARKVAETFLDAYAFNVVLGARPERPIKPDPGGAQEIADYLHLHPQECLFVGDSDVDMVTAGRVGMYPVGALWGFRDREELLGAGAGLLLENPEDLLVFIDEADADEE